MVHNEEETMEEDLGRFGSKITTAYVNKVGSREEDVEEEWEVDIYLHTAFEPEEGLYWMNVYVVPKGYDASKDGLIYCDPDFAADIEYILRNYGFPDMLQWSEAGMQGRHFCHLEPSGYVNDKVTYDWANGLIARQKQG